MNPQQEVLLQRLEAQVRHLTQQLNNVNFAIHSLRSGNQPPSRQHPTPIPALNPRCFDAVARSPNPYAGDYVAAPPAFHPWERPRSYEFLGMGDPTMPQGFIKPDTTSHIFFYEQDCYVLSNFSAFTLQWKDQDFDTSEAAYQWEKFPHLPDLQNAIRDARSAHEAYKIAEENRSRRRPDWDLVKVDIMKCILEAKVSQHEYVKRKLLETGDRTLIEDSWRDDFWGWGPNRRGQNILGRLWMEIRTELQNYQEAPAKKHEAITLSKLPSANNNGGANSQGDTVTVPAEYFHALEKATLSLIPNLHYQLVHHSNCAHLHRPSNACDCDRRHIAEAAKKAKRIREILPLILL